MIIEPASQCKLCKFKYFKWPFGIHLGVSPMFRHTHQEDWLFFAGLTLLSVTGVIIKSWDRSTEIYSMCQLQENLRSIYNSNTRNPPGILSYNGVFIDIEWYIYIALTFQQPLLLIAHICSNIIFG